VSWRWGVGCLGVSLLPLIIEGSVIFLGFKLPLDFVTFMRWPSVSAIGIVLCGVTAFELLSLRGGILMTLKGKEARVSKQQKFSKALDSLKRWAILFIFMVPILVIIYLCEILLTVIYFQGYWDKVIAFLSSVLILTAIVSSFQLYWSIVSFGLKYKNVRIE
jgi:hypothetical protein